MKNLTFLLIFLFVISCGKNTEKNLTQKTSNDSSVTPAPPVTQAPSIPPGPPVNFIAMGDWGRDGKFNQKETANLMGIYANKKRCSFIIALGDNFYETGVKSVDDPQWQTSFEQIYAATSLQVPWYVTLGNHDYGGNVQAQIDYSSKSKRWKLPSRYYSFDKKIDDSTSAIFVIIDSNPFIESYKKGEKENEELNSISVSELNKQDTQKQLHWIDSTLSVTNAKWKIVCGHHPVYSGGLHGNTKELIVNLKPILEKYKVNLYLCGHDHDMQYLQEKEGGVNYFVAGCGSELRPTGKINYTKFSLSSNGFLLIYMYSEFIRAQFIGVNGVELYTTEIR